MKSNWPLGLSRIWLLIWIGIIGIFLLYSSIQKYVELKELTLQDVDRHFDKVIMSCYLLTIIISLTFFLLCVATVIIRTGNYSNDGIQFGVGQYSMRLLRMHQDELLQSQLLHWRSSMSWLKIRNNIRKHSPCQFSMFYCAMSYMLVLMQPYIEAELIKNDLKDKSLIWTTDLDQILDESITHSSPVTSVKLEFINLIVSLAIHSFVYANVFWKFSRWFTITFSMINLSCGIVVILDTCLLQLLIKLQRNNYKFINYQSIISDKIDLNYYFSPISLNILSVSSFCLLLLLQYTLFQIGILRISTCLFPEHFYPPTSPTQSNTNNNNGNGRMNNTNNLTSSFNTSNTSYSLSTFNHVLLIFKRLCFTSSNCIILPFVVGILASFCHFALRIGYVSWSMKNIYPKTNKFVILINLIMAIVFLIVTIIFWIYLLVDSFWPNKQLLTNDSQYVSNRENAMNTTNCIQYHQQPVYASVQRRQANDSVFGMSNINEIIPIYRTTDNNTNSTQMKHNQRRYSCTQQQSINNIHTNYDSDNDVSSGAGAVARTSGSSSIYVRNTTMPHLEDSPNERGVYSFLQSQSPQISLNRPDFVLDPNTASMTRSVTLMQPSLDRMNHSQEYFNINSSPPTPVVNLVQQMSPIITKVTQQHIPLPLPHSSVSSDTPNLCSAV